MRARDYSLLSDRLGSPPLIESSSIEVFAEDGRLAMPSLVFPKSGRRRMEDYESSGKTVRVSDGIWTLDSIWPPCKH